MAWTLHLVAVMSVLTMLAGAFRRSTPGVRLVAGSALAMAVLAFGPARWVVHVGMALLLLSCAQFLLRPYFKVRRALWSAFASMALVVLAATANHVLPWVLIPLGAFLGLWLLTGGPARNRRRLARFEQRRAHRAAAVRSATERDAAREVHLLYTDARLPAGPGASARALRARCESLDRQLRAQGSSDRLIFEVRQIHRDFAPTAIRGYLALPPASATTLVLQDGKTGADLLHEQLAVLHRALDDLTADADVQGSDGLLASHRFLHDRFGAPGDSLRI